MENNFELLGENNGLGMAIGQVNEGRIEVYPDNVKTKRLSNALGYRVTKKQEKEVEKFVPYVSLLSRG